MKGLWFIAIRQLLARKKQTLLMLTGITLGSMGYIVISGFMLGFRGYLTDTLVNNNGHVVIDARVENIRPEIVNAALVNPDETAHWFSPPAGRRGSEEIEAASYWYNRLENDPDVAAFSPQYTFATVFRNGKFVENGKLIGVHGQRHTRVTTIDEDMILGKFSAIGSGNVVIGEGLRERLGLRPGDNIMITNSTGDAQPFRVAGVFQTGTREIDDSNCYASLGDVQTIGGQPGKITKIAVRLKQFPLAAVKAHDWREAGLDRVQSWEESNANFLSIFQVQDILRYTVTAAILLVAGFGIYNILTVIISQKRREIAILRSIGFEPGDVLKIFLTQGMVLGLVGGMVGLAGGWSISMQIARTEFSGPQSSTPTLMSVSFAPEIYVFAFLLATLTTLFSSVLPARSASKLSPIDTIRGE